MTIRWLHRRGPDETKVRWGLGAAIVVLTYVVHVVYSVPIGVEARSTPQLAHAALSSAHPKASAQKRSKQAGNDRYVGSIACSRCHAEIYNKFSQTSMGRSMTFLDSSPQDQPKFICELPVPAMVYDAHLDRHFDVNSRDGRLYQSEYQLDAEGHEVFRNTHAIQWIVGANANGVGAVIKRGDYLFEAPLSYYAKTGKWELSPGYQRGDYGFNRAIAPGCISCHSGRPEPVAGHDGKYKVPAFSQLEIGCENCHGAGGRHIDAMNEGEAYDTGKDPTIVNPKYLGPSLANDICMSCHQTGDSRVYQPGKTYQDFRPGQPLSRIMAILLVPPTRENPPREDHVEHFYSMTMSKCYLASASNPAETQMRCITCHDPHIEPTSAEAPDYFNGKCMTCHTGKSCKEALTVRATTAPVKDNCIGCHMQKREGVAISHTSITNHRILARPEEPFPDAAFNETTAELPDLIYLDRPVGASAGLPPITLLQAYGELKNQVPAYSVSYNKTLRELSKSEPENAVVQAALGHQALEDGMLDEALVHLKSSLQLNGAQAAVYSDLSSVADKKGNSAEAVASSEAAVRLDPYNAVLQKTLIDRLISAQRYAEAKTAMQAYLEEFPEDDFMRKMLAIAETP